MKLLNQIETIRIEIARLTALIHETREWIEVIEAKETIAVTANEIARLHSAAVIVKLDSVK